MLLFEFLLLVYNIGISKNLLNNSNTVSKRLLLIEIIALVAIPIYFFGKIVPSTIVEGKYDMYTTIHAPNDKEYNVLVTFSISKVSTEEGRYTEYSPYRINWSDGTITELERIPEEGANHYALAFDREGNEYSVYIPEPNFTYADQLNNQSILDIGMHTLVFLSAAFVIYKYFF